jgi:type 1 fimbria pilin
VATAVLLALTAAASFVMAFTDSYTDPDTKATFYGVVTPRGLCSPTISHVVRAREDDPEADGQLLLGDTLRERLDAARYKPQFGDFAHAMVTCAHELSAAM